MEKPVKILQREFVPLKFPGVLKSKCIDKAVHISKPSENSVNILTDAH